MRINLVIDESGAKGYADKGECCFGEVGVMAGFIACDDKINIINPQFQKICSQFFPNGKLHITDLPSDKQEELRNQIFGVLLSNNVICVYEAAYIEGLHAQFNAQTDRIEDVKQSLRSGIKVSGNPKPDLLHELLFDGVFAKAVAWGIDKNQKPCFEVSIITDRIDEPIKKRFEQVATAFINNGKAKTKTVTGFDTVAKKVVKGNLSSRIELTNHLDDLSGITFSIQVEESPVTVAADVIVNSVYHLFMEQSEKNVVNKLNTKKAIASHPLENLFYGCSGDEDIPSLSDIIFNHPALNKKK